MCLAFKFKSASKSVDWAVWREMQEPSGVELFAVIGKETLSEVHWSLKGVGEV